MSTEKRDYYEVLNVSRESDGQTIKTAYRKLALQFHPDKNPGDKVAEEKFKEASEAYAILSDDEKRSTYDRFGHQGLSGAGDPFGGFGFGGAGGAGGFEDFFSQVFGDFFGGGGGGRRGGQRGSDLRYNISLSFEEAAFGCTKTIHFPRMHSCEACEGSGAAPGSSPETCSACGGAGQVRLSQGFFSVARPCTNCGGRGQIIPKPCKVCNGRGRSEEQHEVEVDIPAGVDEGNRIRHTGEGEAGQHGGPPGDLFIVIQVEQHPIFARNGNDVICEIPISFSQAALGAKLPVPTLDGKVDLKLPAGTQTNKVFRLRGKGIPHLRNKDHRGDQLVQVVVETPTKLSKEQQELLKKFAEISGEESAPRSRGFFDKVKDILEGNSAEA